MYQRFSFKVSLWEALSFIMMIFEYSLVAIASFIIIYLRSQYLSLGVLLDSIPVYSIFVVTTVYTVLKLLSLGALMFKAKIDQPVTSSS